MTPQPPNWRGCEHLHFPAFCQALCAPSGHSFNVPVAAFADGLKNAEGRRRFGQPDGWGNAPSRRGGGESTCSGGRAAHSRRDDFSVAAPYCACPQALSERRCIGLAVWESCPECRLRNGIDSSKCENKHPEHDHQKQHQTPPTGAPDCRPRQGGSPGGLRCGDWIIAIDRSDATLDISQRRRDGGETSDFPDRQHTRGSPQLGGGLARA